MATEESDMEVEMDAGDDTSSGPGNGEAAAKFQKALWQQEYLPYYVELKQDADVYFKEIKTGIAHSILLRDARPGLIYWVHELDRFMQLYSRRFTKPDHVNLVQLLYSAMTMPKLDFRVVKIIAGTFNQLLARKNLLSRVDLTLDWRPLYELYQEIAYKNLEEDGILLLPADMKRIIGHSILEANHFFPDSATQEILDEVRPLICPTDDSMAKGLSLLNLFIPTALKAEQHDEFGAKLWVDELWHWFLNTCYVTQIYEKILSLYSRLSKDCPGYLNMKGKLDVMCTHLLATFKLEVGVDKVVLVSSERLYQSVGTILVYALGGTDNPAQEYLDKLFLAFQNYLHPSNTGAHTTQLLNFLMKFCGFLLFRVNRERYHSSKHRLKIPENIQLTDQHLDTFVRSILPCLKFAAFSKVKDELVPSIMRILAFLAPGIIIPFVLDLVYPALETVTEPHRLIQSLHILACICVPLVRDDPSKSKGERLPINTVEDVDVKRSYRKHAITILNNILPGLDVNDIAKATLTFQIVGVLLLLIPVVDCSDAIHLRNDLSDEEKELCSATATLDAFVDQLVGKTFAMVEMLGHVNAQGLSDRHTLTKAKVKNFEEIVIERGVLTVFKALVRNCNTVVYKRIVDRFLQFLGSNIFYSKPAMDTTTRIATALVGNRPVYAFPLFFKFVSERLRGLLNDEVFEEDEVEPSVIWYLTLANEIIRGTPGDVLVGHQQEINELLELIVRFKCKHAFQLAAQFVQGLLYSLCAIYTRIRSNHEMLDQPFDQFLPIRHWAKTVDKNNWKMEWHVPSDGEVDYANALVQRIIFGSLTTLHDPGPLTDKEVLKRLTMVRYALEGCSSLCPFFDGDLVAMIPMRTPNVHFETTTVPSTVKKIAAEDGSNFRRAVFAEIQRLGDFLLASRENDTKSTVQLIAIVRILLHNKGIDMLTFQSQSASFQHTKKILSDPLRGNSATIEPVMEGTVAFMHAHRLLVKPLVGITPTHVEAMRLLFRFSISLYSAVRIEAQRVLDASFNWWSFSYKLMLDDILKIIQSAKDHTHKQFKGALYILLNGKESSICLRQDWDTLLKVWPALCRAEHSEKPSIIALFELVQDVVVNNFTSFQVFFNFPDTIMPAAIKLLDVYDGCIHQPVRAAPSKAEQDNARTLETNRNESNIRTYHTLCADLLKLSTDNSLHWRYVELAQVFLSLLLRRDVDAADDVVLLYFRLLTSETIKTRKMAISLAASWLKIHKQKSVKRPHPIKNMSENSGPGAQWPIRYGYRKDNRMMLYDPNAQPNTQAEWDQTRFFYKVYLGFYVWPKEFCSYASPADQKNLNRDESEYSDVEKSVVQLLREPGFFDKFVELFSLEEKKGSDEFDPINYSLFYRLFRNFNTALFPLIAPHLARLMENKREGAQRLAAEIVAGLVNGSRLWRFNKLQPVLDWLTPRLMAAFETLNAEAEKNWGTALATIFCVSEPRTVNWLIQMLFALIKKPSDNSFHIKTRLYLLHCAMNQCEWRIPALWRALADHCLSMVDHSFQNVRYRVGSGLASSSFCDFREMQLDPEVDRDFRLVRVAELVNALNSQLKPLWNDVMVTEGANGRERRDYDDQQQRMEVVGTATPQQQNGSIHDEHKREKLVLITLTNMLYSFSAQSIHNLDDCILGLIPLLAHYSNDNAEEEMKNLCAGHLIRTMGLSWIRPETIPSLIAVCQRVQRDCAWWKAKTSLLRFLQVFTFTNLYLLKGHEEDLLHLVLSLITDERFEVRVMAADTLSGLLHYGLLSVDESLKHTIGHQAASTDPVKRHAGVLAMSAIVQAYPYSVPVFLPNILMTLCKHISEPQPIYGTVKKTLNEFKRTHQDSWHEEHKQEFSEAQLEILTNLLVSPNYYV